MLILHRDLHCCAVCCRAHWHCGDLVGFSQENPVAWSHSVAHCLMKWVSTLQRRRGICVPGSHIIASFCMQFELRSLIQESNLQSQMDFQLKNVPTPSGSRGQVLYLSAGHNVTQLHTPARQTIWQSSWGVPNEMCSPGATAMQIHSSLQVSSITLTDQNNITSGSLELWDIDPCNSQVQLLPPVLPSSRVVRAHWIPHVQGLAFI